MENTIWKATLHNIRQGLYMVTKIWEIQYGKPHCSILDKGYTWSLKYGKYNMKNHNAQYYTGANL